MKRYDPMRADRREIWEKALGLIMACDDEQAAKLVEALQRMAANKSQRAEAVLADVKAIFEMEAKGESRG